MKARRFRALPGLLAVRLVGPLAGAGRVQAPREALIGVVYPLSGDLAQLGIGSRVAERHGVPFMSGEVSSPTGHQERK